MKKILIGLLAVVMCLCMFAGCTNSDDEPVAVAFVIGAHKNFPTLNLNTDAVYDKIYDVAYRYGKLLVVVVDGSPYVFGDYELKAPNKSIDDAKRRQLAKQDANSIIAEISAAKAKTAEVDTLAAITKTAKLLKSTGIENLEMTIYDSGLSTTGVLNFAKSNLIEGDPSLIVDKLRESNSLPDISGIKITWFGIAETSGGQAVLTTRYQNSLEAIWGAIIEASGGTVEFKHISLSTVETDGDLPDVSAVSVVQDNIHGDEVINEPIRLSSVRFVADSSEYISEAEAREALMPLAEILKKRPNDQIVLAGSTASIGTDGKKLSLERANAVKSTLISLGVSENQIYATVGLGQTLWSKRVDDLDSQGNLVESAAAKNRAVFAMGLDCPEAQEVLLLR